MTDNRSMDDRFAHLDQVIASVEDRLGTIAGQTERLAAHDVDHQAFLAQHAADMAGVDEVIAQVDAKIRTTWDTIKRMSDSYDVLASYVDAALDTLQQHTRDGHGGEGS